MKKVKQIIEDNTDKSECIDTAHKALSRSKEVLAKAEQAVSRSYAVVEISNEFLGKIPKLMKF